jgi:DNA mismatch repair protein MutS
MARRTDTPMMRQYLALKARAGEALLLYRLGDFYELFLEDAERAAPLLDLVLTTRDRDAPDPVPMCGIPVHAAEGYIRRLLEAGHAVAIAEQVEDASEARGLVQREIVEVVSPGLVARLDRLSGAEANYLAAALCEPPRFGLAYVDVSTGELAALECGERALFDAELDRVAPRELLVRDAEKELRTSATLRRVADADFDPQAALARVGRLPAGLEVSERGPGARAVAALWLRVAELQPAALDRLGGVRRASTDGHMVLDAPTRRHLELFRSLQDGSRRGTLLELLDRTRTPLGLRLLTRWIGEPLLDPAAIRARQEAIAGWLEPDSRRAALARALRGVGDLERLYTRACLPGAGPRELCALRRSLEGVAAVHAVAPLEAPPLELAAELGRVLVEDPPAPPRGEPYTGYVREGIDADLDRIRSEGEQGQRWLAELEASERGRLGIASLRVRYNRVFGYSIEVSKPNLARVPPEYRRKQTIAGGERFTTDELERSERLALEARARAAAAEARVLEALRERVRRRSADFERTAAAVAELDVLRALAEVARQGDYARPEVDGSLVLEVEAGRHPVVERFVRDGFVPNDVRVDVDDARLLVLTGPNMAGKSTLLRQLALIVLLAQIGAWVPARRARIGIVDRIFTRVGASDSLVSGESTFMVEMRETAAILREATPRSLVLLDEIGRGTSTFDGLSIAWAVAEFLHDARGLRPRALFATHYHELADLARTKPSVRNFRFACAEQGGEIRFLRRMEPGAASRSYGIEVARHAGLPPEVIRRAREVLANLERGEFDAQGRPRLARGSGPGDPPGAAEQLPLFEAAGAASPDPLRAALREVAVERMTPLEALLELDRLRALAREDA